MFGCGISLFGERNRLSVVLVFLNRLMFRLMYSIVSGWLVELCSMVLIEWIFCLF